jgi:hypothetical protein
MDVAYNDVCDIAIEEVEGDVWAQIEDVFVGRRPGAAGMGVKVF